MHDNRRSESLASACWPEAVKVAVAIVRHAAAASPARRPHADGLAGLRWQSAILSISTNTRPPWLAWPSAAGFVASHTRPRARDACRTKMLKAAGTKKHSFPRLPVGTCGHTRDGLSIALSHARQDSLTNIRVGLSKQRSNSSVCGRGGQPCADRNRSAWPQWRQRTPAAWSTTTQTAKPCRFLWAECALVLQLRTSLPEP